jgi:hypothetical protein
MLFEYVLADGKYQRRREKAPCRSLRELRKGKSISTQIYNAARLKLQVP